MAILNSGDKKRFFEILGRKNITYKGSGIRIALDFFNSSIFKNSKGKRYPINDHLCR